LATIFRFKAAKFLKLFLCLAFSSALLHLHADVLDGQAGTLYYDYPAMGTAYEADPFTAPTTLVTLTYGPDISNDIGGDSINITFGTMAAQGFSFSPVSFNGEVFNFPDLDITDVVFSSNFVTESTDWGYSANDVWVNFAGLTPTADSYVNFTIVDPPPQFPPVSTPEPGTLSLTLLGLAAMTLAVLRRRRSA
jgi:hypothetical protein